MFSDILSGIGDIASSAGDWIGDLSWGDIGNIVKGGSSILGVIGALDADRQAGRISDAQMQAIMANLGLQQRAVGVSDAGADALSKALTTALGSMGGAGFFNPNDLNDLAQLYLGEITGERSAILDDINSMAGSARTAGAGAVGDFQDMAFNLGLLNNGFIETQYDPMIAQMTGMYLDAFGDSTGRAIDRIYGDAINDIEARGMGGSSYDVEVRKAAAALAAERRNQDMIAAIDAAMRSIGQRQGLAAGNQAARINNTDATLRGLSGAGGLLTAGDNRYWANQGNSQQFIQRLLGMNPNDVFTANTQAIQTIGGNQGLRGNSLQELLTTVLAPYKFQLDGFSSGGQLGYQGGAIATNAFGTATNNANYQGASAGASINDFLKSAEGLFSKSSTGSANTSGFYNALDGSYLRL